MSIAKKASQVCLPEKRVGVNTVLQFLCEQFSLITEDVWRERIKQGKVHWLDGNLIDEYTLYQAGKVLCYYREVKAESTIPFQHQIIYQDEHIVIADKPHFLPVTPGGRFVNECLLARLQRELAIEELVPVHRLDKDTAGLVMFSLNPDTRAQYFQLFADKRIDKRYLAVARCHPPEIRIGREWRIKNRIEVAEPRFIRRQTNSGEPNAESQIECIALHEELGLFRLSPITGKTHQLRLHMMAINAPILNDSFYPVLQPENDGCYQEPLQLLANKLSFVDPVSGVHHLFESRQKLRLQEVF